MAVTPGATARHVAPPEGPDGSHRQRADELVADHAELETCMGDAYRGCGVAAVELGEAAHAALVWVASEFVASGQADFVTYAVPIMASQMRDFVVRTHGGAGESSTHAGGEPWAEDKSSPRLTRNRGSRQSGGVYTTRHD